MFLRNAWYVAAWDHEVSSDTLFSRILLNEPVVLYRKRDGRVVALEDRCCHRHYPLHKALYVSRRPFQ
jgi:phenylpropionate dioxygenase-like ring-hydroxylating dioxygenase large terminal subunit